MHCSTPGFPVLHRLPEFAQTHVHWVGDAIQPSHPLSSPCPPAFNLSQHQGLFLMSWLFASGGQSIGASASASVLPINIQYWFPLGLTGFISLLSKGLSRVFSRSTIRRHQFFSTQHSALSSALTAVHDNWKSHRLRLYRPFVSIKNLTILNFQNIILLLIEIWLVISLYFIFPSINGI